jgi:mannosyltransferase
MAPPGDPTDAPRRRSTFLLVGAAVVAATIAATAAVARFVTTSPLWLDEALSVNIAALPVGDITGALEHDGHPPLYYVLLHGWMEVFGEGDVAVRTLSGLLGLACLPLAWVAGRRAGGSVAAAAATTLVVALSPFAVRYATEARMYSLVMLFVLVGHLLVRRAVDERRVAGGALVGVAVVVALLLWTHYWSTYVIVAAGAVVAWWGRRARTDERAVAVRLLLAGAAGVVLFLPWLPTLLDQAAHTGTPWAEPARPAIVVDQTLEAFGGGDFAEATVFGVVLVLLFTFGTLAAGRATAGAAPSDAAPPDAAASGGLRLGLPERGAVAGEAATVVLTFALGTIAGYIGDTTYAARYAAVVFPLVAVVVGRGIAVLPGAAAPSVALATLVLLGLAGIGANIVDDRTEAEAIAVAVAREAGPDDAVAVCPDQLGPAVRRALDAEGLEDVPVLAYPTLGDGRFVDWYDYEARNDAADPAAVAADVLDRVAPSGAVWVAWNGSYETFEGDCEAFLNGLAADRGPLRPVVAEDDDYFEHAGLVVFAPQ